MINKNFRSKFFINVSNDKSKFIKDYKTRKSVLNYIKSHFLSDKSYIVEERIYGDGSLFILLYDRDFNPTNIFKYFEDDGALGFIDLSSKISNLSDISSACILEK